MKKIAITSFFAIGIVILGVKFGRAEKADSQNLAESPKENIPGLVLSSSDASRDFPRSVAEVAMKEARRIILDGSLDQIDPIGKNIRLIKSGNDEDRGQSLYDAYKEKKYDKIFEKIREKVDEL